MGGEKLRSVNRSFSIRTRAARLTRHRRTRRPIRPRLLPRTHASRFNKTHRLSISRRSGRIKTRKSRILRVSRRSASVRMRRICILRVRTINNRLFEMHIQLPRIIFDSRLLKISLSRINICVSISNSRSNIITSGSIHGQPQYTRILPQPRQIFAHLILWAMKPRRQQRVDTPLTARAFPEVNAVVDPGKEETIEIEVILVDPLRR